MTTQQQDWKPELLLLNTLVEKLDRICTLYEGQGEPQEMHEAIQEAQSLIKGIEWHSEEVAS